MATEDSKVKGSAGAQAPSIKWRGTRGTGKEFLVASLEADVCPISRPVLESSMSFAVIMRSVLKVWSAANRSELHTLSFPLGNPRSFRPFRPLGSVFWGKLLGMSGPDVCPAADLQCALPATLG